MAVGAAVGAASSSQSYAGDEQGDGLFLEARTAALRMRGMLMIL